MSKGTLKKLFSQSKMTRPLFIPILYTYAAKLAQIPVRRMLTDPTSLTKAISMAYQLLRYDAIVIPFDPTLEAETLGASVEFRPDSPPRIGSCSFTEKNCTDTSFDSIIQNGRMPIVFETIKRLKAQLGKDTDILAGVTGPLTLAYQLQGETFREKCLSNPEQAISFLEFTSQITTRVIRHYGELGVNGILMLENRFSLAGPEIIAGMKTICMSNSNTCNFYELPVILYLDDISDQYRELLFDLPWNGFIQHAPDHFAANVQKLAKEGRCFGMALSQEELENKSVSSFRKSLKKYIDECENNQFLISTAGDPSHNTPVENLHEIMRLLTNAQ